MTHVLVVLGGLNRGGAETWMIQALQRLMNTGVQIDFLVHTQGPFHYQAEVEAAGSRVILCEGLRFPPLYAWNLMEVLRKCGPYDVIHVHNHHFSGFPLLIAATAGVPVRLVQSHLDTRQVDADAGIARRMYVGLMKRLIWNCATVGTAVSNKAADALFPPDWREDEKWQVMLLGIDPEPFERPVNGSLLRQELGIPADATVVGHVGRFEAQKNHVFLLRLAAEYLKRDPSAVFLLAGDGPLRQSTEADARQLGIAEQIRFTGVRKDVAALMRGVMDVFVMPSLFEGLPLVLLETQAAGLHCLLSDTIAEETDVVPFLMHRESLDSPAFSWAGRLQELVEMPAKANWSGCLDVVGIDRSIKGLLTCYSVPVGNDNCHAPF